MPMDIAYRIKVWKRDSGLTAMTIKLNTTDDKIAAQTYVELMPALQKLGYECAFESSARTSKEMHRSDTGVPHG